MSRKLIISCSTLIALSLVVIAVTLISPSALANRMSGKTPFTAKMIEGQISDSLAPGEVGWYQFTDPRPNGAARRVNMSLVFTPNKNNQDRFIEFGVHDNLQLERWYLGTDNLENLGQTFVVARDDDPNTGELINRSELIPNETYYIRVVNNSDFTIYYSIFIDVEDLPVEMISPQELMPKSEPAPPVEQPAAPVAEPAPPADNLPPGIDPNHPIDLTLKPFELRLEEGKIPAGTEKWFSVKIAEFTNPESRYPLKLTLFVTPGDGNMIRHVRMDLFPNTYAHHWSVGNPDAVHNFGAGMVVERDGDPLTAEQLWNGNLNNNDTYLVRLQNGNDFDIDFYLFTDDIINWEFGEPSPPPVPVRVAPGTDPNHALDLISGVNEGDLAPGDEHWYKTKIVDFDGEVNEQLQLTLYMTPNGDNNIHKINFHVYNQGDVHIWNRGDVESMPHFGSGVAVLRDNDPQTGTRFWDGWLIDGNEYLIRVRNSSDENIHYWLFTDDIWDVNLANPEESFPRRW